MSLACLVVSETPQVVLAAWAAAGPPGAVVGLEPGSSLAVACMSMYLVQYRPQDMGGWFFCQSISSSYVQSQEQRLETSRLIGEARRLPTQARSSTSMIAGRDTNLAESHQGSPCNLAWHHSTVQS